MDKTNIIIVISLAFAIIQASTLIYLNDVSKRLDETEKDLDIMIRKYDLCK